MIKVIAGTEAVEIIWGAMQILWVTREPLRVIIEHFICTAAPKNKKQNKNIQIDTLKRLGTYQYAPLYLGHPFVDLMLHDTDQLSTPVHCKLKWRLMTSYSLIRSILSPVLHNVHYSNPRYSA